MKMIGKSSCRNLGQGSLTDRPNYSIGPAPYNILTKYAQLYLDYPITPDYQCDINAAYCESCEGTTMTAVVTALTS